MRVWPGSLSCQHNLLSLCHQLLPFLLVLQQQFRSRPSAVTSLLLFVKGMNSLTLTENQEHTATLALPTTRSIKSTHQAAYSGVCICASIFAFSSGLSLTQRASALCTTPCYMVHICTYVCMHAFTHARMYESMHVCMHAYVSACMSVVYMCACLDACMQACGMQACRHSCI